MLAERKEGLHPVRLYLKLPNEIKVGDTFGGIIFFGIAKLPINNEDTGSNSIPVEDQMKVAMPPRLFRVAFWLALLALTLQLVAVSVSNKHLITQLVSGQQVICTPGGMIWLSTLSTDIPSNTPENTPDPLQLAQLHCPFCTVAQVLPLPQGTQEHIAPQTLASFGVPPLATPRSPTSRHYLQALPRAPPLTLHS